MLHHQGLMNRDNDLKSVTFLVSDGINEIETEPLPIVGELYLVSGSLAISHDVEALKKQGMGYVATLEEALGLYCNIQNKRP
jgi:hypothetical protein